MAVVRLGQLRGPGGFSRLVAVKQLHPELAAETGLSALLAEEARINSAVSHPNVVSIFDVLERDGELLLVMDYVNGETLAQLLRLARKRASMIPAGIVRRVLSDVLHGLQAAHAATSAEGTLLGIVHRDVSPQNVMVGVDGIARVLDFGVAKTAFGASHTAPGKVKGKLAYMAPEQLLGQSVDARTDVFAAGVVLWEALCGRRLFAGEISAQAVSQLVSRPVAPVAKWRNDVGTEMDRVIQKALGRNAADRFRSARDFADALEATGTLASRAEVGAWVRGIAGEALERRTRSCAEFDIATVRLKPGPTLPRAPRAPGAALRWLREQGRRQSAALAAAAALLAAGTGCLAFVTLELGAEPAQHDPILVTSALVLAAGPCTPPPAPPALAPDPGTPPPLRPEALRLEERPRVQSSKLVAHRGASRPRRTAAEVLGF